MTELIGRGLQFDGINRVKGRVGSTFKEIKYLCLLYIKKSLCDHSLHPRLSYQSHPPFGLGRRDCIILALDHN